MELTENEISRVVVDSALKVHRALGPGLLESAYEACMAYELHSRKLNIQRQVGLPLKYEGITLDVGFRVDIMIERKVILELKSVKDIAGS